MIIIVLFIAGTVFVLLSVRVLQRLLGVSGPFLGGARKPRPEGYRAQGRSWLQGTAAVTGLLVGFVLIFIAAQRLLGILFERIPS